MLPYLALLPPFVALGLQLALWSLISPLVWFLFFPAVFLSSWIGGLRPGLAATGISAGTAWYFFVAPRYELVKGNLKVFLPLVVFIAMGVLFSVFHERLRGVNQGLLTANRQVQELLERTQELDRLKSEFFANVSHELRTPLTLILAPTRRLLASSNLIDSDRAQLRLVERNAQLLLGQVNDLLEGSSLESGRVRLQYTETDLAALVRVVAGQFSGLAEDIGVAIVVDAVGPVPCELDADRIQRAVVNLVSNAFKFTPAGGMVRVSLTVPDDVAVVEVADSGPGIAEKDRELVFERFRQVEGDATRRYSGTGLGLAIVHDIAALHGGQITIGEAAEGGALMRLSLPRRAPGGTRLAAMPLTALPDLAVVPEALRTSRPSPVRAAVHGGELLRPAVLVVEDNLDVNQFLGETLGNRYAVTSAYDGPSGLAAAETLRPTLIITDVMMPGMSGEEFLGAVRGHPLLAQTPVLVLTANVGDALRLRLLRAGANDYVTKPFAVEELRARVDNLVRLRLMDQERGQAQARAEGLLEAAPDATIVVDGDGRIVLLNRQAELAFGYTGDELLGQPVEVLLPESARQAHPELRKQFAQRPRPRTMGSGLELSACRKDGSLLPVDVSLSPVQTPDGTLFIAAIRDVSTQRNEQEQLRHLALHDSLTGLPNRLLLLDRVGRSISGLGRKPGCVAVFFVDLDRFKQVNDQRGHEAGDLVLVQVASRLLAAVRPEDTVARLGGDEFAVACGSLTDELEAVVLAERVEQALRAPMTIGTSTVHPTASIGVSTTQQHDTDPEELLRNADTAMYRAKQRGRNRVEVFDEALGRLAAQHFETEALVCEALEADQLTLLYQPILDLQTHQVTGVEALVRIAHPERGLLGPDLFIPTAEETGQIVPLGQWVIGEACRQLAVWQQQGHRIRMSVNLSGRQVTHVDLRELVLGAVTASGADPTLLCVEVTETALMDATDEILESFQALKSAGVHLAIDDFGTGWSSLTYLKRFPVDVIKIDKSFTEGLGVLEDDTAIVTSLVNLAHALGCTVTIEGVESVAQLDLARQLDCDRAQGFLLGRPQPADEVLGFRLPEVPPPRGPRSDLPLP